MGRAPGDTFREYLQSLPDTLLESVTQDYVWLAALIPDPREQGTDFVKRRECCRAECLRRGVPELYQLAEEVVSPRAA
jgi:hypothetical protein